MRIISGTARGRQLATFSGKDIRPTPDRVREALFSMLTHRLGTFSGINVLELFAGTGAQSLEALSRGAKSAVLVDSSNTAAKLIEENIRRCKFTSVARLIRSDALAALPRLLPSGPFDLVLLDPPYKQGHIVQALEKIESLQLLAEDGIICVESAADETIAEIAGLRLIENRKYGSTMIHLYCLGDSFEG
ncbi:MAG: 16S rRNA (guanine(966)-N(2))-methyltransferase RsmD [Desulfuromonadales bacterium]|nr:16S rRNA (guanine(966)-N(2))-methyltransferase RsmD [Desulfuromonadales bacterium]